MIPELWNDTVEANVLCGDDGDAMQYLKLTALDGEVRAMEQGKDTVVGSSGVRLSGGQAQRLALARTLAHPRPVMVLDDPFSALDRYTEDAVFENLKNYAQDKVVILISHRLYHFPEMKQIVFRRKTAALRWARMTSYARPYPITARCTKVRLEVRSMKRNKNPGVFAAVRAAAASHKLLALGTVLCAAASVLASLLPPLLLARIIDGLTGGMPLAFTAALMYFGSLALEGVLASGQETLLEIFGQKMTHALRSEMSLKLTRLPASTLSAQNPGEVAARFSGDVDTVEALFTSGIISMIADASRIISIFVVIAIENAGLALLLVLVLPLLTIFTRHVQKRMLKAQLENRQAVAAISGQVPEAIHNIRTIRALGLESYMEKRYDKRIGESYAAVEKTNFYDAIYSPVVNMINVAVVGIVMLMSASGNAQVLTLFSMSVRYYTVAIINYISRIFTPIETLGMEIQTSTVRNGGREAHRRVPRPARARDTRRGRFQEGAARRRGVHARNVRLRRPQGAVRPVLHRQVGRAGDAGRPHRRRQEYSVQAAAGAIQA